MHTSDAVSVDAIMQAMYGVISGPAGAPRDWDRFRQLFAHDARLMIVVSQSDGAPEVRFLTPEDQIGRIEPIFAKEDFWEVEVDRQTSTFGQVAHILSSYECRRTPHGPPFTTQKKSVQLFYDNSRWWILTLVWHTPRSQ